MPSEPVIRCRTVPESLRALYGAEVEGWVLAGCALVALLGALGVAVHLTERAPGDRPRGAAPVPRPARHRHLTAGELARLSAISARARLMEGEPLSSPGWRAQVRHAWRNGYSGWILACLAGAFSMGTHFGVWWLAAGGGMLGAAAVTLLSAGVMVLACAWIGLGLLTGR